MGLSDRIEAFICELMREDNDFAEFGRNELAGIFGCVPSQINYVIATRFNEKNGYSVESRRGGGGYIRISRIDDKDVKIGESCDYKTAQMLVKHLLGTNRISDQTARLMLAAVSDEVLGETFEKDKIRAKILKNIVVNI